MTLNRQSQLVDGAQAHEVRAGSVRHRVDSVEYIDALLLQGAQQPHVGGMLHDLAQQQAYQIVAVERAARHECSDADGWWVALRSCGSEVLPIDAAVERVHRYPYPAVITDLDRRAIAVSDVMRAMSGFKEAYYFGKRMGKILNMGTRTLAELTSARAVIDAGRGYWTVMNRTADGRDYRSTIFLRRTPEFYVAREVTREMGYGAKVRNATREVDELADELTAIMASGELRTEVG